MSNLLCNWIIDSIVYWSHGITSWNSLVLNSAPFLLPLPLLLQIQTSTDAVTATATATATPTVTISTNYLITKNDEQQPNNSWS